VKVGTTVTFTMPTGSSEAHTATTGPGDPESEPDSYIGQLAAAFEGAPVIPGAAAYPSDLPGQTAAQLTPSLHGNGFWNTGTLDQDENSPPPAANQVTFAQAGSYTFYCLIHPFMKATVTVTS
jgi:plastocyanin